MFVEKSEKIAGKKRKITKKIDTRNIHISTGGDSENFIATNFQLLFFILQHWWCYELSFTFISNKSMIL